MTRVLNLLPISASSFASFVSKAERAKNVYLIGELIWDYKSALKASSENFSKVFLIKRYNYEVFLLKTETFKARE